jgi:hypothetical protein
MAENHPVAEALRAEIIRLATEGDHGALTPELLRRIQRVAKTGHDLLVSMAASPTALSGLLKRPPGLMANVAGVSPDDDVENNVSVAQSAASSVFTSMPYAQASPVENFGMTALREIISGLRNLNGNGNSRSPKNLVEAIAVARERGLSDVADSLEAELGVARKKLPPPAVPPLEVESKKESAA